MPQALLTRSQFVLIVAGMWGVADDLRLTVVMGLRAGLALCRGMRRSLTEDEQNRVANAIVRHLETNNYRIEPGQPIGGHGTNLMPPKSDRCIAPGCVAAPVPSGRGFRRARGLPHHMAGVRRSTISRQSSRQRFPKKRCALRRGDCGPKFGTLD
jgi:hypothetical protein